MSKQVKKTAAELFSYGEWVSEQADKVRSAVSRLACSGIYDAAVFVMPSNGATQGELIVSTEPMALEVLHFAGHGTRIAGIAYSQFNTAIWDACRRSPICPTF
jgi:hypothetical protein